MIFNKHYESEDHAFLSPSKYHWVNYSPDKLTNVYNNWLAKQKGTRYHNLAKELIELGEKLPRAQKSFNMFVNDAIGFRMTSEQILYYSDNCFGTADAIAFRKNKLRIHDLKTGVTKTSMIQLEIYAALFCLEYKVNPEDIEIELRIYQNDEIIVHEPDKIRELMEIIIEQDRLVDMIRAS